jgi:hypothetical protein
VIHTGFIGFNSFHIDYTEDETRLYELSLMDKINRNPPELSILDTTRKDFLNIHTEYWNAEYYQPCFDGENWYLTVCFKGIRPLRKHGSNGYPDNWTELLELFDIDRK